MRPRLIPLQAIAFASLATMLAASVSRADSPAVRLSDAGQSGVFNVAAGQASIVKVTDPQLGEGAWKLDYHLPPGSAAGVWAKAFPKGLDAEHLDRVNLAIKGIGPDQARVLEPRGRVSVGSRRSFLGSSPQLAWAASMRKTRRRPRVIGKWLSAVRTVCSRPVRFQKMSAARWRSTEAMPSSPSGPSVTTRRRSTGIRA